MTSNCEYGCDGSGFFEVDQQSTRMCVCRLVAISTVPTHLRSKRFSGFDVSRAPEQVRQVRAWADAYADGCHSLILFGSGKGTGKTHLMAAAALQVIASRRHRDFGEVSFTLAPSMLADIAQTHERNEQMVRAAKAIVLFLDDVGQGDEGDPTWLRAKKRSAYFRLINAREMGGLTTVCTSNLETIEQFADVVGEAATDRLFGMAGRAGLVKFNGIPSYRLRELLG